MKFPYSMLRDYVETKLDADAVGDLLTMAGFELEDIEEAEGDKVLDIKVVSNRGDGLSVFGLAREVLAKDVEAKPTELYKRAAKRFGASPGVATEPTYHWEAKDLPKLLDVSPQSGRVSVSVETEDCTRYACLLFDGVRNGDAPEWLQKRLRQSGQRPISLLVDLSNYVMLEVGQPLHTFDLDKLAGPAIVVRKARAGEKLTTLDGGEHELRPDQMMICDAERPIAAAGIMGGEATEVDSGTTRVLLESAHFLNTSVRRTRKQLGLSTDASYRFERSVDPEGVVAALERFAELLAQVEGGGSRIPGCIDVYPNPLTRAPIELDMKRSDMLLGMPISEEEAVGYLERLGFQVMRGDLLMVAPPTWRPDVVREEDLIEELGRVHGFEQIPERLPTGTTIRGGTSGFEAWTDKVREACVRSGFIQTISHSLRDRGPLDDAQALPVELRNPNSPDMAWLRNSILPCLADNAKRNGGRDVHLFEIGRVFVQIGDSHVESVALGFLSQGALNPADWLDKQPQAANFFTLKTTLEQVFAAGGIHVAFDPRWSDPRFHPTRQAGLACGEGVHGVIGQIHPDIAEQLDLPEDTVLAEMHIDSLYEHHHAGPKLKPISRNPAVRRDIALLIDKSVPFETIDRKLGEALGDVLEKRWLFDVYEGKGIPEGKHSLAIALQLRKQGSNFTDEEANQVREKAVQALAELGGTPR
ncbi:MAG TPA: phenylalanine--tRNA ligase subunit beta [Fimbriimonadaceae bacterium]|nr:phenylalanine--tRNA ligase subunit beta [Fimbriimonadaceae bacterium]